MAASGALASALENLVEGTSISLSGRTHVRSRSPRLAASGRRSNVGKGSRQNGSVTSGEGLALRAGTVGLGEEACRTVRTSERRGRACSRAGEAVLVSSASAPGVRVLRPKRERRARKLVGAPGRAASGVRCAPSSSLSRSRQSHPPGGDDRVGRWGGGPSDVRGTTDATSNTRCLRTVTDRGNPTV